MNGLDSEYRQSVAYKVGYYACVCSVECNKEQDRQRGGLTSPSGLDWTSWRHKDWSKTVKHTMRLQWKELKLAATVSTTGWRQTERDRERDAYTNC